MRTALPLSMARWNPFARRGVANRPRSRHWPNLPVLLLVWTCLLGPGRAASAPDDAVSFDAANRLYEQGHYAAAIAAYQKLIAAGPTSAALHFNLGNALFRGGQTGRAIIQFRRAAEWDPRDPDILANLQFARASVPGGGTGSREHWRRWLGRLSLDEWTKTTAAFFWSWMFLLILGLIRPAVRKPLRPIQSLMLLVLLLSGAGLARVAWDRFQTEPVVIVVPEATVRLGPLEESQASYQAKNGLEMLVLDHQGDWVKVEDYAQRPGWVRKTDIEPVFP